MIVAFTKDWDDVPTCTTHILREMGKTLPVLWVSSIGTRKPSAASGKDLRRIAGRILQGLRPAVWKENNLRVLKPILIPKAETPFAQSINRRIFAWYVRREIRGWMRDAAVSPVLEYWSFVPNAIDLLPAVEKRRGPCGADTEARTDVEGSGTASRSVAWGRRGDTPTGSPAEDAGVGKVDRAEAQGKREIPRVVYYCADDWTQFHNLDGAWMGRKEQELLGRADVVFATSRFLEQKLAAAGGRRGNVVYMPHGVEYARFAAALDRSEPLPTELRGLPRPVIGFYGNLHPWVDFGLIAEIAKARPRWSFVLIGEKYAEITELESMANVHLLGRREHSVLHDYCRGFDAAIIPYDMTNPRMESVNPVKTKELLAAGLPIVASDVPELRNYGDDVLTCKTVGEWLDALDRQVARTDQAAISTRVAGESWERKVTAIRTLVDR